MSTNQCRFSIGKGDVVDERLRPLLSAEDRRAANLTEQAGKRKPANAQHEHADGGGGEKKPRKKKGEEHGRLRVRVVDRTGRRKADAVRIDWPDRDQKGEQLLAREWASGGR